MPKGTGGHRKPTGQHPKERHLTHNLPLEDRRNQTLQVCVSESERIEVAKLAKAKGVGISDFLRPIIFKALREEA